MELLKKKEGEPVETNNPTATDSPIRGWKLRIDEIGEEVEYCSNLAEKNSAELTKLQQSLTKQEKTRQSQVADQVDGAFQAGKSQAGVVEDTKTPEGRHHWLCRGDR